MEFVQNFPVYLGHVEIPLTEKRESITKNLTNQTSTDSTFSTTYF